MKRIIYRNDDGGISIYIPSPYSKTPLAEQVRRHVPQDREHHVIDASELPERDEFRRAWAIRNIDNGVSVHVDFDKAKEIKKEILRRERDGLLSKVDKKYVAALADGKDTKEIKKERKRLLDITKLCDKTNTVEELKAITINDETDTEDTVSP